MNSEIVYFVCLFGFFFFGLVVVFGCCVSIKMKVLEIKLVCTHDDSIMPPVS